jgi:hypothetical protein
VYLACLCHFPTFLASTGHLNPILDLLGSFSLKTVVWMKGPLTQSFTRFWNFQKRIRSDKVTEFLVFLKSRDPSKNSQKSKKCRWLFLAKVNFWQRLKKAIILKIWTR